MSAHSCGVRCAAPGGAERRPARGAHPPAPLPLPPLAEAGGAGAGRARRRTLPCPKPCPEPCLSAVQAATDIEPGLRCRPRRRQGRTARLRRPAEGLQGGVGVEGTACLGQAGGGGRPGLASRPRAKSRQGRPPRRRGGGRNGAQALGEGRPARSTQTSSPSPSPSSASKTKGAKTHAPCPLCPPCPPRSPSGAPLGPTMNGAASAKRPWATTRRQGAGSPPSPAPPFARCEGQRRGRLPRCAGGQEPLLPRQPLQLPKAEPQGRCHQGEGEGCRAQKGAEKVSEESGARHGAGAKSAEERRKRGGGGPQGGAGGRGPKNRPPKRGMGRHRKRLSPSPWGLRRPAAAPGV